MGFWKTRKVERFLFDRSVIVAARTYMNGITCMTVVDDIDTPSRVSHIERYYQRLQKLSHL